MEPMTVQALSFPSLEMFIHAADLNGSQGSNRDKSSTCQINATNDWQAIQAWLMAYQGSVSTERLYRMESERFLLWCIIQQKKPLSSINRDDIEAYAEFLKDPQPQACWCAPRTGGRKLRGDPAWRPFTGPLSESSRSTALSAIQSLLSYLVSAHYLAFNPFVLIKRRIKNIENEATHFITSQKRAIGLDEWTTLLTVLDNYPETTPKEIFQKKRIKFIIAILYFLGLRLNELASHGWNAFHKDKEGLWWFYLIGKGKKPRLIPVADDLLREVIHYRHFLNKSPVPETFGENVPIITDFKQTTALTTRHIYHIFKTLTAKTAEHFISQPDKVERISKFSPHWLRHFAATMQSSAGISRENIKDNLGHADIRTTDSYIHEIDKKRHLDMQKIKLIMSKKI